MFSDAMLSEPFISYPGSYESMGFTSLKTNECPLKIDGTGRWFISFLNPFEMVPFRGHINFPGCILEISWILTCCCPVHPWNILSKPHAGSYHIIPYHATRFLLCLTRTWGFHGTFQMKSCKDSVAHCCESICSTCVFCHGVCLFNMLGVTRNSPTTAHPKLNHENLQPSFLGGHFTHIRA